MPPVVAVIATALIEAGITAVIATFIANAIVSFAVNAVIGAIFSSKPKKADAPSFSTAASNRTITVRQPAQPRRVVYGQVRVGGVIAFMHSTNDDTHLHMIVVFAGHEVQEIGDIYFNDVVVPLDVSGEATGTYAGYARVIKHLGSDTQAADATLMAEAPDKWTANHRLRGCSYVYIRFIGNSTVYANGLPNVTALLKGKKDIYDPRAPSTGYSANAALCVANYMMDTRFGMGAVYASEIDAATLIASANVCDEAVALSGGGTEPRYLCNGAFDSSELPENIIGEMLSAMVGKMIYVGGKWLVRAAYYEVPTVSLGEGDARGEIRVKPRISRASVYNAVKGVFVSPANQWQPADFPAVINSTYQAQDDGERIYRDISLPYTNSGAAAQRIAKILLEEVRQQITVEFPAKLVALKLRAGDTVMLNWARFGWVNKVFRVENWQFELYDDSEGQQALGVGLVLRETAAAIYTWSAEETAVDLAPDTNLPDPFTVGAPSGLTVASGTDHLLVLGEGSIVSRLFVSWAALANVFVTRYEVEYKKSSASAWVSAASVLNPGTTAYIQPVEDGVNYDVRVRAINSLGVRGAYATIMNHMVIGKTEAPPPPDTFTIARLADGTRRYAWTQANVPADVRSGGGYQIRYKVGATSDWTAMTPLHNGLLTASPLESNDLAAGTYTWAMKTIDSSGNESASARFISGEIGDPRLKNVLLQRIEYDLGWPGTLTGCFNHAGILLPLSTSAISALPAAISSLASTVNAIGTNTNPIVYETPVIDLGANVSFTPLVTVFGTGVATLSMKTGTAADGTVVGVYGALGTVAGKRYVQIKVSMADTAATIANMVTLIDAEAVTDEFEDVNTLSASATWFSRTAAGHFKIGSKSGKLAAITSAKIVALQNVGAGWSWELLNKTSTVGGYPAAEFKIYNASNVLADAVIDVELKGPKI